MPRHFEANKLWRHHNRQLIFVIILFLVQYLLSLLQYTHCLLIPVFTYEFAVFDITILTEILQYQPFKKC